MSLVERALKKLQESSRAATPGEAAEALPKQAASLAIRPGAKVVHRDDLAGPATQPIEPIDLVEVVDEAPAVARRTVVIDRDALRAMALLPPVQFERQIGGQYQQVKRPLITSVLGKAGPEIPHAHAIMLASALPGEGKTFTSVNLALSMALDKDIEVLLVDADVAKPHLSRIFGAQSERGLLDLLADSTLRVESAILPTTVPRLSFLPAGRQTETATELLASARMEQIVAQLARADGRRIVLFDSPPLLLSTESRALVASVGQVVLVVRAESTLQQAVRDAIAAIGEGKSVSLILNQTSEEAAQGYYGYGTYGSPPAEKRSADVSETS